MSTSAARPGIARALAVCACCALLLAWPLVVRAELIDSLKISDQFPDIQGYDLNSNLLDPPPVNDAWATPGYHPLGVFLDNYSLTREQVEAAKQTGCGLVRLAVPMEHFLEQDEQDWAVLDQVISRLSRAGLEVLPVLTANSPIEEFYVPFCQQFATRYGSSIKYYQLLDNINYTINLSSKAYADLVLPARTAIKQVDPDAVIVCGGIRGVDLTYLQLLEAQGALHSIDVFAFNLFPTEQGLEGYSYLRREHSLPYMEQAVAWLRARGKEAWVTSYGVSTCYNQNGVDQVTQAAMYARGSLYLGWIGVGHIIFAAIQDTDPDYAVPTQCCGLLDVTGRPKASYFTLQALNHAVNGAYHIQPSFDALCWLYQRPEAADIVEAAGQADVPGTDGLVQFKVRGIPIYTFWFYAPQEQEYRLVYWMDSEGTYPTLMTLNVVHLGLTPVQRYILLNQAPQPVDFEFSGNSAYIPYIPAGRVPGVIHFKVNEHGRPS
jgi:hypothetical protein